MQNISHQGNPQNVYIRQRIMTASPAELVVMLYDGCKKNLLLAQRDMEKNDPSAAHGHLTKAQAIVLELVNSLDLSYAVAKELMDIYEFLINEIGEINIEKNPGRIPAVLSILEELREAWQQVAESQKGNVRPMAEALSESI